MIEETAVLTKPFNKNGKQIAVFAREDEDSRAELAFAVLGLSDDDFIEFDKLTVSNQKIDGNSIIIETDDTDACAWYFDKNVQLKGGFEGELPADWQNEFSGLEKQEIVRTFLGTRVYFNNENKIKKAFKFGQKSNKTIKLVAVFNGAEVLLTHTLPGAYVEFLHKFKQITRASEIKRGEDSISSRSVVTALGRLYDEMKIASEDYEAGDVPLHHKVTVVREAFGANLQKQQKKLTA